HHSGCTPGTRGPLTARSAAGNFRRTCPCTGWAVPGNCGIDQLLHFCAVDVRGLGNGIDPLVHLGGLNTLASDLLQIVGPDIELPACIERTLHVLTVGPIVDLGVLATVNLGHQFVADLLYVIWQAVPEVDVHHRGSRGVWAVADVGEVRRNFVQVVGD